MLQSRLFWGTISICLSIGLSAFFLAFFGKGPDWQKEFSKLSRSKIVEALKSELSEKTTDLRKVEVQIMKASKELSVLESQRTILRTVINDINEKINILGSEKYRSSYKEDDDGANDGDSDTALDSKSQRRTTPELVSVLNRRFGREVIQVVNGDKKATVFLDPQTMLSLSPEGQIKIKESKVLPVLGVFKSIREKLPSKVILKTDGTESAEIVKLKTFMSRMYNLEDRDVVVLDAADSATQPNPFPLGMTVEFTPIQDSEI